jgi:hypothetical protein
MGSTKLAVLPEPVVALAHTSLPCSAMGIACDCTGVGRS